MAKYFYWPGLRSAVSRYCRSCHTCQLAGKPNQIIRPAPLQPIPVMGEPFERLILDCVGPLPKSKAGYQYILTLMCSTTRFPEAVPLRNLKAKTIVKELIKFCSTFGLPRVIQTDQGTNFKSKVFEQVLNGISVNHVVSSAYHPQSQGALERFHQTLKSMMRAHCVESGKDWADDLPLLLFAIRETVQESLGYSPAELIFGHTVHGPLKLLSEQLVADNVPLVPVSEYVTSIRERLRKVCERARINLAESQADMKEYYDRKCVARSFQPGESVLLLLAMPGSALKPDSFPLPRMEDCIDRVGPAKFVTKLDLLKGYWQVPLTPRASEISAFVTPDDFMQYSVMAFGMRNAPSTFQRLMRIVLNGVENCEAYLDDIVIYSSSWEEHASSLREVFSRLAGASPTLNLAKCEFAKATVVYLGKVVGQGEVRTVDAKIAAVMEFPAPRNKRELRRFLGMAGYYRGFCRNFASVVSPLTDLLSIARVFVWTPACEQAFRAAKDLLCNAPILSAPDFGHLFKLEVDASATGAGAILIQESELGIEHPVCYFSKKFTLCQRRYSTIEKEALALLLALQHFEVYSGGSSFPIVVYTDHNPLVFLARMCNSNNRLMRWSLIVQEFYLDIRHKKGSQNIVADAVSRVHGAEV